jgi:hypothetical protein
MKLTVIGSVALAAALVAGLASLAAQGGSSASGTEQTIMGCVKGDGSDASPWTLAGVVIPPPPPLPPPGPPGGRGRGGEGAPPAGGPPPGRAAAPAPPPPPPPPPQDYKLVGINMTPWNGMRAQVTGSGTPAGFQVSDVRSMWGTCKN